MRTSLRLPTSHHPGWMERKEFRKLKSFEDLALMVCPNINVGSVCRVLMWSINYKKILKEKFLDKEVNGRTGNISGGIFRNIWPKALNIYWAYVPELLDCFYHLCSCQIYFHWMCLEDILSSPHFCSRSHILSLPWAK